MPALRYRNTHRGESSATAWRAGQEASGGQDAYRA
jgi:hypothetical protein